MTETMTQTTPKRVRRNLTAEQLQEALTALAEARAEISHLKGELSQVQKDADNTKLIQSYNDKARTDAEAELEQIHCLLDVLPGCLPRTTQTGEESWNKRTNVAMTRLASWLVSRKESHD